MVSSTVTLDGGEERGGTNDQVEEGSMYMSLTVTEGAVMACMSGCECQERENELDVQPSCSLQSLTLLLCVAQTPLPSFHK